MDSISKDWQEKQDKFNCEVYKKIEITTWKIDDPSPIKIKDVVYNGEKEWTTMDDIIHSLKKRCNKT